MEAVGLVHRPKRNPKGITKADRNARKSDDKLKRNFRSDKPLIKCVTDITEIKGSDDKLYVSAIFDCFDATVLGLAMDTNMKAPLCVATLENAYTTHPGMKGCICHSDRGTQYTSHCKEEYRMKHIVVDLEMNNIRQKSKARRIFTMETIEIGAVMLDDNLQEISSFRTYVKPEYNDGIVKKISKLTGITDDMVVNAPNFNDALRMFTNWCLGTGDDVTIYAWSESDYGQISKEMTLKGYEVSDQEAELLGNAWSDFQQEFDSNLGFERQLSLKMALDMAGVDFSGREHDSLDDARNTAELLQIFRDEELFDKTLRKIKEYMEPTEIGNTIGSLIDFSAFACA